MDDSESNAEFKFYPVKVGMTEDVNTALETNLTEIDILVHGIKTVQDSIDNIINLLTMETGTQNADKYISPPLLLSLFHGLSLQINEIKRRLDQPYLFRQDPLSVDQEIKDRIIQTEAEMEELRTQVKVQQERLRTLESEERMAGFREKISRMESDIDFKDSQIAYYKEFENQIVANLKRSRSVRKNLTEVRSLASEKIADSIDRNKEDCTNCAKRYEMPPRCKGHPVGNISCNLFAPKGYTEKEQE